DTVAVSGRIAPDAGLTRLELTGHAAGLSVAEVAVPGLGFSLAVEAPGGDPLAATSLPFAFRAEADALELGERTLSGGAASPLVATANGTLDLETMRADANAGLTVAGGR